MGTLNGIAYDDTDQRCADCGALADGETRWVHPTFLPGQWNSVVTLLCGPCSQKPANQGICGTVCAKHFDDDTGSMADVEACEDCQTAIRERWEKTQREDTIDPAQPWGQHIALTCVNHPELTWTTKNIGCIGARSIFYSGWHTDVPECPCPMSDLRVVPYEA
jgi:hypothetical protein